MAKYILKRIIMGFVTILVLATIAFVLIRLVPGSPFSADAAIMSPEAYANLCARYGIDQSLWDQYQVYMNNLFHGDLGESMQYPGVDVITLINRGIGATLRLGVLAFFFAIIVGGLLGIAAALRKDTIVDRICMAVSTIGISLPNYIVAVVIMFVFALKLELFPVTGLEHPSSYVLPVFALAINPIANIAKLVKSSMLDALNQDYIILAKSKGLHNGQIICMHALRNALLPVITYTATMVAGLLIGSFVIENMFTIPGVGKILATSITNRDYTTLTGMVVFSGAAIIICNLIVD
ncbi:MAG: ABC transporter permease, partial [Clostridiales bacterium]